MTSRRSWMIPCLAFALLAASAPAAAQRREPAVSADESSKKEASQHFKRGADLFEEGLYRPALIELKRAYELLPNYRVLYNIGQAHIALGEFVEGMRTLDAFLVQGGRDVEHAQADEVRETIAQLRQRTATISVRVDHPGATISLDGIVLGDAPLDRAVISVGRHRLTATAGSASASEEIEVAGGDHRALSLTLIESEEPVVATVVANAETPRGLSPQRRWSLGLVASAGAVGLTGMGIALMARSAHDDHEQARSVFPGDRDEIDSTRQRVKRTSLAADVLFGGAAALAVTGLVLWLVDGREKHEQPSHASLRFGIGPHALVAEGRF